MRGRAVVLGAAIVAAYLVVVTLTAAVRPHDARPLYDGFVVPTSYRFVDPPPFFASGNVKPQTLSTTIALGPRGTVPAGFATPDGQFVVSLGAGAISRVNGATSVAVHVTPLAPSHLAAVPGGLRANGNAYRVEMTYEPIGASVTRLAKPGTLLMEIPELGNALFVSVGPTAWSSLAARPIPPRELSLSATFASSGDYLAATNLPELAAPPGRSGHGALLLGVGTAVVAVVMFAAVLVVMRRRNRSPAA